MVLESQSVNHRQSISRGDLQSAIRSAVKKSDPDCEAFVDIIVQHVPPGSRFGANWAVRGVKFGKSDRSKSTAALATIVARMQQEFKLSDDSSV